MILLITCMIAGSQQQSDNNPAADPGLLLEGEVEQVGTNGFILGLTAASKEQHSDMIRVGYEESHKIQAGDYVFVWCDYIRESDPPQTTAVKLKMKQRRESDD
ncbi:hypothetical protein [Halobacillus sp. B23F22_1]|uniref:hypothetical protein n=1 Tax=Halobacillus sp. B23F22_1 TaxID=3459514 RepID=UPI00373E7E2E